LVSLEHGENMPADDRKRIYRRDMLLASAMLVAGLVLCALSISQINATPGDQRVAQATQPLQSSPAPAQPAPPAEAKPGGERPTTPAPEPARPAADAQKAGATPVLPPAPAEKTAAPIKDR
jgi:hypothetical protein